MIEWNIYYMCVIIIANHYFVIFMVKYIFKLIYYIIHRACIYVPNYHPQWQLYNLEIYDKRLMTNK